MQAKPAKEKNVGLFALLIRIPPKTERQAVSRLTQRIINDL
jgi:hypothetical protein